MISDFFQGAMAALFVVGTLRALTSKFNPSMALKIFQSLIETVNNKSTVDLQKEGRIIKLENKKYSFYFPSFPVEHLYDVVCFSDEEKTKKVPFTFFRHKNEYVYVPFVPSDIGLERVFIGIKYMTQDTYKFFEIEEDNLVHIPSLIEEFEDNDEEETNENTSLAEAYDE
jgi:hypothetical protein